jgi:hypothetical protein
MNDVPSSVYKYLLPDRAAGLLDKLLIRFSQASVLNDALEFKPLLKGMGTRADVEAGVRERLKAKHPESLAQVASLLPPDKAEKLIAEVVSDYADVVEANYDRSVKEVYRRLDQNFGVLSLSEIPTSPLMWSHYADGGRGLLIEFDPQHPWFWTKRNDSDSFRHLRKVKYEERVPAYFLNLPDDVALYSKSVEWSYEKEWRIIHNFNEATVITGKDAYDTDVLLFAVPPSCIRGVIIGYKATKDSVDQVKSIVAKNSDLSHVSFRRAVLQDDGAIEIVLEPSATSGI